jgi:hypothetical protein
MERKKSNLLESTAEKYGSVEHQVASIINTDEKSYQLPKLRKIKVKHHTPFQKQMAALKSYRD